MRHGCGRQCSSWPLLGLCLWLLALRLLLTLFLRCLLWWLLHLRLLVYGQSGTGLLPLRNVTTRHSWSRLL
ncbi:hypothetical protein [Serratia sp. MMO-151]|uniref:hypothetical protein n=1 Tax=Serratia sp. MMO-151 TaxID=3081676 RepID=UPI0030764CFD